MIKRETAFGIYDAQYFKGNRTELIKNKEITFTSVGRETNFENDTKHTKPHDVGKNAVKNSFLALLI
jgi:hypothetical protein